MKNYEGRHYCQDCPEDYFSKLLCEPLSEMFGWADCDATWQVLAQARTGNPAAQFMVGAALEEEGGANLKIAVIWYQRSAKQDYQPAKARLAAIAANPDGTRTGSKPPVGVGILQNDQESNSEAS